MTVIKFLETRYPRTTVQKEQVFSNKLTGNLLNVIDTLKSVACVLTGCMNIQISKIDTESFTVTWTVSETNQEYINRVANTIGVEISKKTHDLNEVKLFVHECKQLGLLNE